MKQGFRRRVRGTIALLRLNLEGFFLGLLAAAWVGEMGEEERGLLRALVRSTRYLTAEEIVWTFQGNHLAVPYNAGSWRKGRLNRLLYLADKLARDPHRLMIFG